MIHDVTCKGIGSATENVDHEHVGPGVWAIQPIYLMRSTRERPSLKIFPTGYKPHD